MPLNAQRAPSIRELIEGADGKYDLLDRLVSAGRALTMDGGGINAAEDYRSILLDIDLLTGAQLALESVVLTEADPRRLDCVAAGRTFHVELDADSQSVDVPNLLAFLNDALRQRGVAERLWYVWDADMFGQDFGLLFADPSEREALFRAGLPVAINEAGQLPLLPFDGRVDGHPAIAFADGLTPLPELAQQLARLAEGTLTLQSCRIEPEEELVEVTAQGRTVCINTDVDGSLCRFADHPEGAVVAAFNEIASELQVPRRFALLFGPSADSWRVVFVAPAEAARLIAKYN